MEFTREEVEVLFQAVCLADAYYQDSERRISGFAKPDPSLVAKRRADLKPIIDRIMNYADRCK